MNRTSRRQRNKRNFTWLHPTTVPKASQSHTHLSPSPQARTAVPEHTCALAVPRLLRPSRTHSLQTNLLHRRRGARSRRAAPRPHLLPLHDLRLPLPRRRRRGRRPGESVDRCLRSTPRSRHASYRRPASRISLLLLLLLGRVLHARRSRLQTRASSSLGLGLICHSAGGGGVGAVGVGLGLGLHGGILMLTRLLLWWW